MRVDKVKGPPTAFQAEDRGVRLSLPAPGVSMFRWFKREDWRLVKTISRDVKHDRVSGKLYFHLFESDKGNRKVEIKTTLELPSYINLTDSAKRFDVYQEKIYRWEHGRYDPDIPRYNQIPEEETANALKGKIE